MKRFHRHLMMMMMMKNIFGGLKNCFLIGSHSLCLSFIAFFYPKVYLNISTSDSWTILYAECKCFRWQPSGNLLPEHHHRHLNVHDHDNRHQYHHHHHHHHLHYPPSSSIFRECFRWRPTDDMLPDARSSVENITGGIRRGVLTSYHIYLTDYMTM